MKSTWVYNFCVLFLIIGLCNNSFTQSQFDLKKFDNYNTDKGLSNNYITAIVKDKLGFIWIGTANGLNRFDGHKFVTYYNIKGDEKSLSNNFILSICVDKYGFIWVGTQNGLNRFDTETEEFQQFLPKANDVTSIPDGEVNYVYEDKDGEMWFGCGTALTHLNTSSYKFTTYQLPNIQSVEDKKIRRIIFHNKKLLLSVWGVGVYSFKPKEKQFELIPIIHNDNDYRDWVNCFYIDNNGKLFAVNGSLLQFDTDKNCFITLKKHPNDNSKFSLQYLSQINDGKYIAGTNGNGFYIYNNKFQQVQRQMLDKDTFNFTNNFNSTVLVSNTSDMWFGTSGNGVFLYNFNQKKFINFEHNLSEGNSIPEGSITGIFATAQNELILSSRDNAATVLNVTNNKYVTIPFVKNKLNSKYTKPAIKDTNGNVWMGTWGGGVNRIDATTGKFSYYTYPYYNTANALPDNFVTSISQNLDGSIWVATVQGVAVIKTDNGNTTVFNLNYHTNIDKALIGKRCNTIKCDAKGMVWIGTDANGLVKFDPTKNDFIIFKYDINNIKSIGSDKINYIFFDSKNNLWVGCGGGGGLNLWQESTKSFKQFTTNDGLPSNQIQGIIEDDKGILWVTTDKGLSRFDSKHNEFKNYFKEDGLLSNHFYQHAIAKSPVDGRIFAGLVNGMVSFMPDSIENNNASYPLYITDFKIYNLQNATALFRRIKGIEQLKSIVLNHFENTFSVSLVTLEFISSNNNQYAYKLEGLNKNWIFLGNNREITFSDLPHGTYKLYIKATNSDGIWYEKEIPLIIKILPPWWKTWWAYLLYAIACIGIVYSFIQFRITGVIKREKELANLRTKISSDLHDDVGTILSGLAMQSQMLTYTAKPEQKEPLLEISNMSRDAMERMRDTVWTIDSRKDKYENLIDRMRSFAEKNLAVKNITHQFEITNVDTKRFINPEKRQAIYLIFKEAITNITKHSNGNHVVILFNYEKNKISLTIKDNGTIQTQTNTDGLGLNNMKMRAGKIGGKLIAKYDNGFVVSLEV